MDGLMNKPVRLSQADMLDLSARIAGTRPITDLRDNPATRGDKRQKYGNTKVTDGDLTFDSKAEHKRWVYLSMMERAKNITDLRLQHEFEIIPAQESPSGKRIRATVYRADFTYRDKAGKLVVEDVKGAVTPEFRIKRKLMLHVHGIEVQEIRS
jgi:hypothetical protein